MGAPERLDVPVPEWRGQNRLRREGGIPQRGGILAVQQQAELIVWPESMMPYLMLDAPESFTDKQLAALHPVIPVERWKDRSVQKVLSNMAEESRASLIVGAGTFIGTEGQTHSKRYNSAVFIQPTGIQGRYDKIHRVPFGVNPIHHFVRHARIMRRINIRSTGEQYPIKPR